MREDRKWPSRRVQYAIIIVLAVGAAVQVFCPPLTRAGRAEKLYLDAWFAGWPYVPGIYDNWEGREAAVRKLEAALRLSPGNSLYEQALVWHYPREKLADLLKSRRPGPEARRLAAGLIYQHERALPARAGPLSMPGPGIPSPPGAPPVPAAPPPARPPRPAAVTDEHLLNRLDELAKIDPANALPHYRKAFILRRSNRLDDAYAEVLTANRIGTIRFYVPAVRSAILDGQLWSGFILDRFEDLARFRDLARGFLDMANERLRHGRVDEARAMLEAGCQMGTNLAASQPHGYIQLLAGRAVVSICEKDLGPLYKDFGMKNRAAALRRTDEAFERAVSAIRAENSASMPRLLARVSQVSAAPLILNGGACAALGLAVLIYLFSIPARTVARRRQEEPVTLPPWGQGWLARMFLAVYIPTFLVWAGIAMLFPSLVPGLVPGWEESGGVAVTLWGFVAVLLLSQLALLVLPLRALHRRYDDHTATRTGIFRFIFKAPAAAKAWTRKYLIAAMAAQLVFLACCFLLTLIVYKPIFGGHPWQFERLRIGGTSAEQALVARLAADVQAAAQIPSHGDK